MPHFRALAACLLVVALGVSSVSPCSAALVGYWKFDGCTVTDASGNALDLTSHGSPTCGTGRFNQAWMLNGVDQYLDHDSSYRFVPLDRPWTVSAWVRTTSSTTAFTTIVGWYRCGANPGCSLADGADYLLGMNHRHAYFDMRDDGLGDAELEDSTLINDDHWHFLVATRNATRDTVKLYVDGGVRVVHATTTGNLSAGTIRIPLEIGRLYRTGWGVPDYYFPGSIDEVRIHDQELTAKDVASLFAQNLVAGVGDGPRSLPLAILTPNPVRGTALAVAFDLPEAGPAQLELFDALGRRIATREVGGLGSGRYQVDLGAGRVLPAGVYTIRLTQSARSGTRSVSVLR